MLVLDTNSRDNISTIMWIMDMHSSVVNNKNETSSNFFLAKADMILI